MENGWVGNMQVQVIISLLTMLGAGISVYVGVRVALAEIRRDIRAIEEAIVANQRLSERDQSRIEQSIKRLEDVVFRSTK